MKCLLLLISFCLLFSPGSPLVIYVSAVCTDSDGDGVFVEGGICGPVDCDDSDPDIYPGGTPVRLLGTLSYFEYLQDAYNDAAVYETIQLRNYMLTENLNLVINKSIASEVIFKEFTYEISRFMYPKTPDNITEVMDFIKQSREQMKSCTDLVLAAISKADNEFIGCCGLHSRGNANTPELGIWIKKSSHGQKYGREAINTLAEWVEGNLDVDYLLYPVDRKNIPSRKIPESLNGVIFKEAKVRTMNNTCLDEVVYKIAGKNNPAKNSQE